MVRICDHPIRRTRCVAARVVTLCTDSCAVGVPGEILKQHVLAVTTKRIAVLLASMLLVLTGVQLNAAEATHAAEPALTAQLLPTAKNPRSVDELFNDYVQSVEPAALEELQAIMLTKKGFIIRTGALSSVPRAIPRMATLDVQPRSKLTPEQFATQYSNVSLRAANGPAESTAAREVLGGMGYGSELAPDIFGVCSVGFAGFNASGAPAAISAGHCTEDGKIKSVRLEKPSSGQEYGGLGAVLGHFGFSQFGGRNNAATTLRGNYVLGNLGTDVSVINRLNPGYKTQPYLTGWANGKAESRGPKITGISQAKLGAKVCKSGRTTGYTCGTVDEVGIFVVGGFKNTSKDIRAIRGFGMKNRNFQLAYEGDSGGGVISGSNAVGITSAIADDDGGRAYFADITRALKATPGYSIKLALNKPKFITTAPASGREFGTRINGSLANAPAGTIVRVSTGGKTIANAKVDKGKFSFKTPSKAGNQSFNLQGINGFNKSSTATKSYKLVVPRPKITSLSKTPSGTKSPQIISGTGIPKATVTLTRAGKPKATASVSPKGIWSIKPKGSWAYGTTTVSATQKIGKNSSPVAKATFKLIPKAPKITTPKANAKFAYSKAPRTISGSGVNGATIKVSAGKNTIKAKVVGGKWKAKLPVRLGAGTHRITATQTIAKTTSAQTRRSITVAKPVRR